jgi:hypothetical protein
MWGLAAPRLADQNNFAGPAELVQDTRAGQRPRSRRSLQRAGTVPRIRERSDQPMERRLPGWAERTRTRKCRFFVISVELLEFAEHFCTRDFSRTPGRDRCRSRRVKATFASSCPMCPATESSQAGRRTSLTDTTTRPMPIRATALRRGGAVAHDQEPVCQGRRSAPSITLGFGHDCIWRMTAHRQRLLDQAASAAFFFAGDNMLPMQDQK